VRGRGQPSLDPQNTNHLVMFQVNYHGWPDVSALGGFGSHPTIARELPQIRQPGEMQITTASATLAKSERFLKNACLQRRVSDCGLVTAEAVILLPVNRNGEQNGPGQFKSAGLRPPGRFVIVRTLLGGALTKASLFVTVIGPDNRDGPKRRRP
jgi:hypothetical protein